MTVYLDDDTGFYWLIDVVSTARTWDEMVSYATDLNIDDINGWRLPTRAELSVLNDVTKVPEILDNFDIDGVGRWTCWTADEVSDKDVLDRHNPLRDRAYFIFFGDGGANHDSKLSHHAALLVADGYFLLDANGLYMADSGDNRFVVAH